MMKFLSIIGAVAAGSGMISSGSGSEMLDTTNLGYSLFDTAKIQDCFNCTLSGNRWAQTAQKCSGRSMGVNIKNFMTAGKQCGDPENFCQRSVQDGNKSIVMSFDATKQSAVPPGYFCIHDIDNEYQRYGLFTNEKDQTKGKVQEFFRAYKRSEETKKGLSDKQREKEGSVSLSSGTYHHTVKTFESFYWDTKGIEYAQSCTKKSGSPFLEKHDKNFTIAQLNMGVRTAADPFSHTLKQETADSQANVEWINGGWLVTIMKIAIIGGIVFCIMRCNELLQRNQADGDNDFVAAPSAYSNAYVGEQGEFMRQRLLKEVQSGEMTEQQMQYELDQYQMKLQQLVRGADIIRS